MFQKPTFGSNTPGFGSFSANTTSSPFGFKPTASTSAFGAPSAFGAGAQQNTTSTGLFGSSTGAGSTLFGAGGAATTTPAFGTSGGGFGFGANTGAATGTGGLFGGGASTSGLFGAAQPAPAFGTKPPGFGFGTTTPASGTGLFGTSASTGTGLFGQQNSTLSGGGLFSNTTGGFGQQQQQTGTAHAKYNPLVGTDVMVVSGTSQNINTKHHCITCMKEYEGKSLEELRLEDYTAGRKGPAAGTGLFGGFSAQPETKPLFGASGFGQPATTSAPGVFGGGTLTTGSTFGQNSTFSFGGGASTSGGSTLFGANKPAFGATPATGTGLFGATSTQAPSFGTPTSSFAFGPAAQTQAGGLFGAKPATSGFGTTPNTSGFGTATSAPAFGSTASAPAFGSTAFGGGLFGAKPPQSAAPAFGTGTPAFGSMAGGFGTGASGAGGTMFGSGATFGKPATAQPSFGFGSTQQTGLGGAGAMGGGALQAKPTAGFGLGGGLFQQPQPNNTFKTGLDGGLGGGLFGNTSTLGGTATGLGGFGANTSTFVNNNLAGSSAAGTVHDQILTLAARPYGDSSLFKDLLPDSTTTTEDVLKPTNPAAVKAVLEGSSGSLPRITSPGIPLRVQPRATLTLAHNKKSLFDGLEESDPSLEDKLCLKPSRKRLVLKKTHTNNSHTEYNTSVTEVQQDGRTDSRSGSNRFTSEISVLPTKRPWSVNNSSLQEREITTSGGPPRDLINGPQTTESADRDKTPVIERNGMDSKDSQHRQKEHGDSGLEVSSDRHSSWLGSQLPRTDRENRMENESTPRLYPNLEKELPGIISERRASWLTTIPLPTARRPLSSNPHSQENSLRDLGVRSDSLEHDKENIDNLSVSEEEVVRPCPPAAPPHPAGVKLTRPGYYTNPSLEEMTQYLRADGTCVVPHLTIGRLNYGNVYYDCPIDVAGLDLDALVHFLNKEVIVYPEDSDKPPVGQALNRRAVVTLDRVWPRDKTQRRPITDPDRLLKMDYEGKLRRVCDKHDTKFIEYRPATGSWVFRVEHFSKYGLTDSDEEDDPTPDVLKRQLQNQSLQKAAPPPAPKPPAVPTSPGLSGAGAPDLAVGLGGQDSLYAMQQTSLNLLNGAEKAFEMDTTENNTEAHSFYQDTHREFGVKSPTSELARLEHRQSHNVQLMKASLYADAEMEDNVSLSTGDQLVPQPSSPLGIMMKTPSIQATRYEESIVVDEQHPIVGEEQPMKSLIVQPKTIVLNYHRKVPPFKQTIAGRLDAACIADMSVCRSRHSRIGFGPAGAMAYVTSYDAVSHLPNSADFCDLGKYLIGRSQEDWSESVVTRLAIGHADNAGAKDLFARHLETLLEYSTFIEPNNEDTCPRLTLKDSPSDRRVVLTKYIQEATSGANSRAQYGVTGAYCYEVWKLCEALWGADLENDGVPGTDEQSIVNRHKSLLSWFSSAVAEATDRELGMSTRGEDEDEADGHSRRVWTLLLGGRILEACKVARENGDLNMAVLIAQAASDAAFRSLVSRQLTNWREVGADKLISSHRLAALQLLAGQSLPRDKLLDVDWLRALHATARYLCPQVPSLEQIIRTYESFFANEPRDGDDDQTMDLTLMDTDEVGMECPLPPYMGDYDIVVYNNGKKRRVLDLRYELIRARAFNTRPKLQPAAYTPDPLDYSLCFLLGTWFGTPSAECITGAAQQLEARGAWHHAVLVLTYHPNDSARAHMIRSVLSRHAPARADSSEAKAKLELVSRLRIPERWLLLAQAHRAKYEHLPSIEVEHLIGAEQWNAAHRVLLEELLPEAVLADDMARISPLLEKLSEAALRHEVSGWESGGQALYHYLRVCEEIRGLVSAAESERDRSNVHARLEALRPQVAAACRALGGLHTRTARHAAARAEMGTRLVQLALAAGEPSHHLAALLSALRLPPDCTAHAQQRITTDLAEQASDLCIESSSSSPISSHRRSTVRS